MLPILLVIFASYAVVSAEKCILPQPDEIDWSKANGAWYPVADSGGDLNHIENCVQMHDMRAVDDGIRLTLRDRNFNTPTSSVPHHWIRRRPGVYVDDKELDEGWVNALQGTEHGSPREIHKAYEDIRSWDEEVFYTDYDNYFLILQCNDKGKKMIWAYHRNPKPTAEDILQIWRKIIDAGRGWEKVPLYPVDCSH